MDLLQHRPPRKLRTTISRLLGLSAALLFLALQGGNATARMYSAVPSVVEQLNFDVYLDKRRIGSHQVSIQQADQHYKVVTNAQFDIRVLFFSAYKYQHLNIETWQNGCLTSLEAKTNDNGSQLVVSGQKTAAGFTIDNSRGTDRLPSCVRSFAYWDLTKLDSTRLLNSQTGELETTQLSELQTGTLQVAGKLLPVKRYVLAATPGDIELTYTVNGDWLELKTEVDGGRILRYRRTTADAITL